MIIYRQNTRVGIKRGYRMKTKQHLRYYPIILFASVMGLAGVVISFKTFICLSYKTQLCFCKVVYKQNLYPFA